VVAVAVVASERPQALSVGVVEVACLCGRE
jgi:hypothetical protein